VAWRREPGMSAINNSRWKKWCIDIDCGHLQRRNELV